MSALLLAKSVRVMHSRVECQKSRQKLHMKKFVKLTDRTKAELPQVGILLGTQFPSLGIFISKKVGF